MRKWQIYKWRKITVHKIFLHPVSELPICAYLCRDCEQPEHKPLAWSRFVNRHWKKWEHIKKDAKRVKQTCQWSFMKSNIQWWKSIVVTVAVNGAALTFLHILLLTQFYFKYYSPKSPDQLFQGDTGMLGTSFPLLFFDLYVLNHS